ncbi:MAG: hypothetical protein ACJ74V_13395, partial [Gaiellaceae bacterium]
MPKGVLRWLSAVAVVAAGVIGVATFAIAGSGPVSTDGDTPVLQGGIPPLPDVGDEEYRDQSDLAFISRRTAGNIPLDL